MADSVGSNRPRPMTATRRSAFAVICSQLVGELPDSVGGNRPRLIMTSRSAHAVIYGQVVDESTPQSGTEKSSLADKSTEQASPTSSPEHGSAEHPASSSPPTSSVTTTATNTASASSSTTAAVPASIAGLPSVAPPATTTALRHESAQPFRPKQTIRHALFKICSKTSRGKHRRRLVPQRPA